MVGTAVGKRWRQGAKCGEPGGEPAVCRHEGALREPTFSLLAAKSGVTGRKDIQGIVRNDGQILDRLQWPEIVLPRCALSTWMPPLFRAEIDLASMISSDYRTVPYRDYVLSRCRL
jgi:hypothetical protein